MSSKKLIKQYKSPTLVMKLYKTQSGGILETRTLVKGLGFKGFTRKNKTSKFYVVSELFNSERRKDSRVSKGGIVINFTIDSGQ